MENKEKYSKLEKEVQAYKKVISEAADIIMEKEVSDFPIFVLHQQELELGIPIVEQGKTKGNWSVHASSLEEFVSKQIIHQDRVEEFKSSYKSPSEYLCLFVLSELGAQFIYVPRNG